VDYLNGHDIACADAKDETIDKKYHLLLAKSEAKGYKLCNGRLERLA
jgi:hypothetical protein